MLLSEVINGIPGRLVNDGQFERLNFCTAEVDYSFLTFMEKEKYVTRMNENVTCVLCTSDIAEAIPSHVEGVFLSENPKYDFYIIHNSLVNETQKEFATVIDESAQISHDAVIAEHNVIIGKNVVIEPNVVIYKNVTIGDNSVIHSNSVIGGQSFDYAKSRNGSVIGWVDAGNVVIGKRVEICSSVHIAQACLAEDITLLEDDCKIDSFVHIGHGAHVGKRTLIAAGAIIGGNSIIGNDSWVGINATVSNRILIGDNSRVSLGSVVTKNVENNETVTGNFAIPHDKFLALLKRVFM